MRDLDITTLRLFISVCETGNIARAGERASIVGSAISKRLAQLEDTVGAKLLTRKRRGVEPTEAGETLLEHARAILASSDRIERDMSAYASGVKARSASWQRRPCWRNPWPTTSRRFCKWRPIATSGSTWKNASARRSCAR